MQISRAMAQRAQQRGHVRPATHYEQRAAADQRRLEALRNALALGRHAVPDEGAHASSAPERGGG